MSRGELVYQWTYCDTSENPLGLVKRFEKDGQKEILPFFKRSETGEFLAGIPDGINECRPLYGLDSVQDYSQPVYFVEGEKCATALHGLGLQAVCNLGGSKAASKADWKVLDGISIAFILPDNDMAGEEYARAIYRVLRRYRKQPEISIVRLPELPSKGDICDYLKKYDELYSWNELSPIGDHPFRKAIAKTLLQDIEHYRRSAPPEWNFIQSKGGLVTCDYRTLQNIELPEPTMLLHPWLYKSSISLVYARRGIGKTYFCLSCAIALAGECAVMGYKAPKGMKVLYVDGEMQASELKKRVGLLTHSPAKVLDNLLFLTSDLQDRDMPDLGQDIGITELENAIETCQPDVIFIDNLSCLVRSGHENEGESWTSLLNFSIRQRRAGRSVVYIHHENKSGGQRGSSRKEDLMDIIIRLKRPDDEENKDSRANFIINFEKNRSNYGPDFSPRKVTLNQSESGLYFWENETADGGLGLVADMIREGKAQKHIATSLGFSEAKISRLKQQAKDCGLL